MNRRIVRPWHRIAWALLLLVPLAVAARAQSSPSAASTAQPRQVAAPPADFLSGQLRLPAPADVSVASRSALLPVRFALAPDGRGVFEADVPLEQPGDLALVPFSPDVASWSIAVAAPDAPADSAPVPLDTWLASGAAIARSGSLDELGPAVFATRFDLHAAGAAPPASWRIRIERAQPDDFTAGPTGYLLVAGGGSARLVAHLATFRLVEGQPIGIVAALDDDSAEPAAREQLLDAALDAQTPMGPATLPMFDDGAHADGAAGDGVFGVWLPDLPPGEVLARVVARGAAADGSAVLRTVQQAFPILPRTALLTGDVVARAEAVDGEPTGRITLDVGVALTDAAVAAAAESALKLQVSAEVWGAGAGGKPVPVCWLSTMADADTRSASGAATLRLAFDARWLQLTGAAAPLELRALRLQDPGTHAVHDVLERAVVDASPLAGEWDALVPQGAALSAPTLDMLMGAPSARLAAAAPSPPSGGPPAPAGVPYEKRRDPALMLVHGYCSSGAIWPAADFSQPKLVFSDPNADRTNDQFALLLQAFGAQKKSFGVVAHSQGGMAALHLYTFYQSGLDHALGPRLIQSLATPYNGTPLAGNLAVLGQIFGASCGSNNDMTPTGAALWLSTIPTWARSKVFYWTTSDAGSACNFLTSLFLASPEDGVVEKAAGQLPGAHNMGHKTGWCHTTGMTYPASYTDHVRNAEMNAEAAR